MLSLIIAGLVLAALFNFGIGLIVIIGSKRSASHTLFFVLTSAVTLWAVAIALFLNSSNAEHAAIWAGIYYAAAAVIAYGTFAFAYNYLEASNINRYGLIAAAVPTAIISAIALTPHALVKGAFINFNGGNEALLDTRLYVIYAVYFICYFLVAFYILASRMRGTKKDIEAHNQLRIAFIGMLSAGMLGVYFNLYLPLVGDYQLIWLGPLFSIIYVSAIFYAIVRHGLFDVRLALARIVAYLLLLLTIAIAYGLGIFSVSAIFFKGAQGDFIQNTVNILLAVFVALSFQPLKQFFDKITDKLFFRRNYDAQAVLNELGLAVSTKNTVEDVAGLSLAILGKALKPIFATVLVINESEETGLSQYQSGDAPDAFASKRFLSAVGAVVADVPYVKTEPRLSHHAVLNRARVGIIMRLTASNSTIGYLVVGNKQNGSSYNTRDIQMLSTAEDELSLALQNALRFEEIRAFNQTLQQRVDEATARLRRTNAKLRQLDEAKDEFVSMASHQLRTPLTSVKGYLSLVLDGDAGKLNDAQVKMLTEAFNSSQRMVYLIADFLNVSRLKTGKFMLEYSDVDMVTVVQDEVKQLQSVAESRGLKLHYEPPSGVPRLHLDETKMRQVVMNLLDNATYYSRAGSTITVELYVSDGQLIFKVKDKGIGVPLREQHDLFEKFFRATNARQTRPDGTGIGLYMIKKVVAAHGGTIIFSSVEGKGSTFGFSLKLDLHMAQNGTEKL